MSAIDPIPVTVAGSSAMSFRTRAQVEDAAEVGLSTACFILLMAGGATAIETAYAGRSGTTWGLGVFWAGQLLLYGSAAWGVLRARVSDRGRLALLVFFAICTFFLKVAYSPLHFSFPDEFQHWRTLTDILRTHHLFHPNPSLPVSPTFPGLEIATAAVISTTGLSVFAAGLVVSGFAHVLLVSALFLMFRQVFSGPVSGLATVVFATEPHFEYFDSIFGYQTLALPLAALALLVALRLVDADPGSRRVSWWVVGLLSATALVVTHHLTTFALLALLLFIAVISATRGKRQPAAFALVCSGVAAIWIGAVARGTVRYLGNPIIDSLLYIFPGKSASVQTHGSPTPAPLSDRVVAYVAVVVTLYLIGLGWRRVWRLKSVRTAEIALAAAAASYPFVLFIRVFAGDSAELAGRLLTFVLLPVAAVIAPLLATRWSAPEWRRPSLVLGTILLLAAGGIVTGWPPWWERLPGSFRIASFERGVDQLNVAPAFWARDHLSANNHFAGDFVAGSLIQTYGNQVAVLDVGSLFYSRRVNEQVIQEIRAQSIKYLVVDERMTRGLPATGGYFAFNPFGVQQRELMPVASLSKFDRTVGISRIYDNGTVRIYELGDRYSAS